MSHARATPGPRLGGARDRALELRLAHLRAPGDVELARLLVELAPGRRVAAAHRRGLLAERGAHAARQVLEGLLLAGRRLRLLHVAPGRRALLLSGHAARVPVSRGGKTHTG